MKLLAVIAALLLAGMVCLHLVRVEGYEARDLSHARERDSLQRGWDQEVLRSDSALHLADSLSRDLDSARMYFPPPLVIRDNALKLMRYAKVDAVQDSLMSP